MGQFSHFECNQILLKAFQRAIFWKKTTKKAKNEKQRLKSFSSRNILEKINNKKQSIDCVNIRPRQLLKHRVL